jgi:hypothetical protein
MTRMFVVLCALTLAGCGAAKIDSRANARAEYQKSIDDEYRACINDNLKNVEKCQAKRALMEANEHSPNNVVAGSTEPGNTAEIAQRTSPATKTAITRGTTAANTTQATSSLPPRIPQTPQATPSQMPAPISLAPPTTSSLPAQISPPARETVIVDHPEPVDALKTPRPF